MTLNIYTPSLETNIIISDAIMLKFKKSKPLFSFIIVFNNFKVICQLHIYSSKTLDKRKFRISIWWIDKSRSNFLLNTDKVTCVSLFLNIFVIISNLWLITITIKDEQRKKVEGLLKIYKMLINIKLYYT